MIKSDLNRVDKHGDAAIHLAFSFEQDGLVKMLATHGASLEIQNSEGKTIFHLVAAEYRQKQRMVSLSCDLLEHSYVDLTILDNDNDCSAHIAFKFKQYDLVKLYIQNGFSPNTLDKGKLTILHKALRTKQYDIIQLCLEYGADKELPDDTGITPNNFIANVKDDKMIQLFYSKESDIIMTNPMVSYDRTNIKGCHIKSKHGKSISLVARWFLGICLVGLWYIQNSINIKIKTDGEYLIDIFGYHKIYLVNVLPWKHIPFIVAIILSSILWYMFY